MYAISFHWVSFFFTLGFRAHSLSLWYPWVLFNTRMHSFHFLVTGGDKGVFHLFLGLRCNI